MIDLNQDDISLFAVYFESHLTFVMESMRVHHTLGLLYFGFIYITEIAFDEYKLLSFQDYAFRRSEKKTIMDMLVSLICFYARESFLYCLMKRYM